MTSSDKFNLKWNDFETSISSAVRELRNDLHLSDVTLVTEDREHIHVHKVVLAVSSPFFKDLLKTNQDSHLLIHMNGVKAKQLHVLLDFIYYGEVGIFQEDLQDFLALAKEFEIKGLTNQNYQPGEPSSVETKVEQDTFGDPSILSNLNYDLPVSKKRKKPRKSLVLAERLAESVNTVYQDFDAKNDESIMEKIGIVWKCKLCGKEDKYKSNIRDHVEVNHTDTTSYPCSHCGKDFKSRNSLSKHVSRIHKELLLVL